MSLLQSFLAPFPDRRYLVAHKPLFFSCSNFFCLLRFLEDTISRNSTVQAILSSSKPSFLVWDKVYQKLTDVEEETWLLRAIESMATFFSAEVTNVEHLRFVLRYIRDALV
jgi:hypothetical protein